MIARVPTSRLTFGVAWVVLVALAACGAPSVGVGPSGEPDGGGDRGTSQGDAGTPVSSDGDGTPVRDACTSNLGHALTTGFGRLDGYLVAILPPGHHGCPSDSDHVHLQIRMSGEIYDIAITVVDTTGGPVALLEKDLPLTDGLHDASFTATPKTELVARVQSALQHANHVSIFATGYTDRTGAHKVHRNGFGEDGALIIDPTAATSHALLFHFSTQHF
jgi:hypothetical protein